MSRLKEKLTCYRNLGTPTEELWPGVTSYPDFKASFPKWQRDYSQELCSNLDANGLDLLEKMLVYDPAGRISAKQACNHPYFEEYEQAPPNVRMGGYENAYINGY